MGIRARRRPWTIELNEMLARQNLQVAFLRKAEPRAARPSRQPRRVVRVGSRLPGRSSGRRKKIGANDGSNSFWMLLKGDSGIETLWVRYSTNIGDWGV